MSDEQLVCRDGRFVRSIVCADGNEYPYAMHFPEGMLSHEATGLAVVLSLHEKEDYDAPSPFVLAWEALANECREFMVVELDAPGGAWSPERDDALLENLTLDLVMQRGADIECVYLTGLGAGAEFARVQAATHPWLFSAAAPVGSAGEEAPELAYEEYELPFRAIDLGEASTADAAVRAAWEFMRQHRRPLGRRYVEAS